jgi:hypothetical protein
LTKEKPVRPVHLHKHQIIAQAFAKRHHLQATGRNGGIHLATIFLFFIISQLFFLVFVYLEAMDEATKFFSSHFYDPFSNNVFSSSFLFCFFSCY